MNVLRGNPGAFRWTWVRLDSPGPFRVRSNLLERRAQCYAPCDGIRPGCSWPIRMGLWRRTPGYGVNDTVFSSSLLEWRPQAIGPS